jgi:HEPN domain-containing protein
MRNKGDYLKGWQLKARHDFNTFYLVLNSAPSMTDVASFHAQQAVEKWLKCLLEFNDIAPPYTHDIVTLLEKLEPFYPEIIAVEWLRMANMLSNYAVDVRYLDAEDPTTLPYINLVSIEEALLAFQTLTKEKLGAFWEES